MSEAERKMAGEEEREEEERSREFERKRKRQTPERESERETLGLCNDRKRTLALQRQEKNSCERTLESVRDVRERRRKKERESEMMRASAREQR